MRCVPPMPVFDSYIKKYDSGYVFEHFLDEGMKPNETCPADLRCELEHLDDIPESEWVHPHSGVTWGELTEERHGSVTR